MKFELKDLIKSFDSDSTGDDRYREFLYHCYNSIKAPKKKKNVKRSINKYDIIRQDLIKYLIANEKAVRAELTK